MTQQQNDQLDKIIASIAKLHESQDRTDEQMRETAEQMKNTDEQMKKTDERISQVSDNIDGVNKSIGKEVEEFFYSSLLRTLTLGDVKFDYISKNYKKRKSGDELEIDIFLENGNSVGIIEVKNKVSDKHIQELERDIKKFEAFSPAFKGYKIYGALAGKVIPDHVQAKALKKGFFILKQQGDHVEITPPL